MLDVVVVPARVIPAATRVVPVLPEMTADQCLRCHGYATRSDLPIWSAIRRRVVRAGVPKYVLRLVDVVSGVTVRHYSSLMSI